MTSERGEADGNETCTFFYLEGEQQQVVLIPLEGEEGRRDAPYSVFARDLSQALDDDCLTVEGCGGAAERLAGAAGIEGVGLVVHEVTDDDASRARADVKVGGSVEAPSGDREPRPDRSAMTMGEGTSLAPSRGRSPAVAGPREKERLD